MQPKDMEISLDPFLCGDQLLEMFHDRLPADKMKVCCKTTKPSSADVRQRGPSPEASLVKRSYVV